jgi:hypothetical protein
LWRADRGVDGFELRVGSERFDVECRLASSGPASFGVRGLSPERCAEIERRGAVDLDPAADHLR